ncbi:hypothetical protein SNEBB_006047 [Seison nebaliae]|nr:hypothetical protein SNEBB_006047 [Seison nebaliae]
MFTGKSLTERQVEKQAASNDAFKDRLLSWVQLIDEKQKDYTQFASKVTQEQYLVELQDTNMKIFTEIVKHITNQLKSSSETIFIEMTRVTEQSMVMIKESLEKVLAEALVLTKDKTDKELNREMKKKNKILRDAVQLVGQKRFNETQL